MKKKHTPITEAEIQYVIDNAPKMGITAAARATGHPCQGFYVHLKKRGIALERLPSSYRVDATPFLNVSTPQVSYVLGLMWADGHLRKKYYEIGLEIDADDLATVRSVFEGLGDWSYYKRIRRNRDKAVEKVYTSNATIHRLLCDKDYLTKSNASPTKILEHIPANLHRYFWRGYVDGDGCFYVSAKAGQFCLSGSHDQDWSRHEEFIQSFGIGYTVQRTSLHTGRSSTIRVTNCKSIIKLGEYLYEGYETDLIGFPRKYEKFKEIVRLELRRAQIRQEKTQPSRGTE